MQSHFFQATQPYSDEEIKQAIALSASELLKELNSDYLIYHQAETIRFGELPLPEQQALKQALSEQTLVKYQF